MNCCVLIPPVFPAEYNEGVEAGLPNAVLIPPVFPAEYNK